ncbi:MAG: Ig-like domain-containing protein [Oscillospiraceae bacterium]|nr:Ig-like domain-containing protein [Oscillospiraceae bacterium]
MKRLRKTLSTILVFVILLGVLPLGQQSAMGATVRYTDIGGHWAAAVINRWYNLGFIDPEIFPSNQFRPDRYITRGEFFSLIISSLGATAKADISAFTDLIPNTWQYDVAAIANQMGIANGYPDNTMRPDNTLLRQDAATLAARALGMSSVSEWSLERFSDSVFIAPYAITYVSAFVDKGIMGGYPDGSFRPRAFLTRAEAIKILDNLFINVYMPETGLRNVYLQGGLLIQSPGAELRDVIIDGDIIIGDGVGDGNVVISNSTINGSLVVRGGGPNSITLSNTTVSKGIYVASFGADTRVAVADNSTVPILETVSNVTVSGSGVAQITVLENAMRNATVNLNGVSLDRLSIDGPGAQVNLNSGHTMYATFDNAGQGARLDLAANTSVGHLTVSAPGAIVTGSGFVRNLIINNSGAVVSQSPEFLTMGLNIIATVAGESVSSAESQWANNNIDRLSAASNLKVELLSGADTRTPFDQSSLNLTMVAGSTASEAHVTQAAANRVPLTQRNNRWAYWVGFFVPAPPEAANMASVTYTYVDGSPITLPPRTLDYYNGRQGLLIYLPVFREANRESGVLKEVLFINWGGHLTENIHFLSTTMHLASLNSSQTATLQKEFDDMVMHSIHGGALSYSGAEAVRRILASDNPLGLSSNANRGLDAINRAVTIYEARSILEDTQFALDLTVHTSGTSQYSALSDAGKQYVVEQVLAARKTIFANPAAVKSAFDKAVQTRLAAETSLLGQINNSADYIALRKIIEVAANAAVLQFQTGAAPYNRYSDKQKNDMAEHLWKLRQYRSIQEVIDAIRRYLNDPSNLPDDSDPNQMEIVSLAYKPNAAPANFSVGAPPFSATLEVTIKTSTGQNRILSAAETSFLDLEHSWRNNPGSPISSHVFAAGVSTFTALRQGNDTLTTLHRASGKSATITVNVRAPIVATALSFRQKDITMYVGDVLNLWDTDQYLNLVPANATDLLWNSSNDTIAAVSSAGVVTAGDSKSTRPAIVTVSSRGNGLSDSTNIWVFENEYDIFVDPERISLQAGSSTKPGQVRVITASPLGTHRLLRWAVVGYPDDAFVAADIASVSTTGIITVKPTAPSGTYNNLIRVELFDRNTNTVLSYAYVTLVVREQISYELVVTQAVVQDRTRTGIPYGNLVSVQPLSDDYDLPDKFIWESSNPIILFSIDGGATAHQRLEVAPGVDPLIVTNGIGRSTISIFTSEFGPRAAEDKYIISAPRGVSGMEFYLDTSTEAMKDPPDYGRMLEMINGTTRNIRAYEPGQEDRAMAWLMYWTDPLRTRSYTSANTLLAYNTSSKVLSATAMGLARVVVVPTVANLPDGWEMVPGQDDGKWFARGNIPLFVLRASLPIGNPLYSPAFNDPENIAHYTFNPLIDENLSGFRLRSASGMWLAWSALDPASVMMGVQVICDVNGRDLTREKSSTATNDNDWNPDNVPLVAKTADSSGSNELFVWIQPRAPQINPMIRPASTIVYTQYMSFHPGVDLGAANRPAITYEVIGDFTYADTDGVDIELSTGTLLQPLKFAAWTLINGADRVVAANRGLTSIVFGRLYNEMPTPGALPYAITFDAEMKYTTNEGFVNKLDPAAGGPYYTHSIPFTDPLNPAKYTFTVIADPPSNLPLVPISLGPPGVNLALNADIVSAASSAGINLTTASYTVIGDASAFSISGTTVTFVSVPLILPTFVLITDSVNGAMLRVDFALSTSAPIIGGGMPIGGGGLPISPGSAPIVGFSLEDSGEAADDSTTAGSDGAGAGGESGGAAGAGIGVTPGTGTDTGTGVGTGTDAGTGAGVGIGATPGTVAPGMGAASIAPADTTVPPPKPPLTAIAIRPNSRVAVGGTLTLLPYVTPYNADQSGLVWTSANTDIAVVSGGIVTGIKAGTVKITVSNADGTIKAQSNVTVRVDSAPLTSISISQAESPMILGSSRNLTLKYRPAAPSITGATWRSSDETVARVEPDGRVHAVGAGTAVITATSVSGGHTATYTVVVRIPVTSISLPEASVTLPIGQTYQLYPTVEPAYATSTTATYTTSSRNVATVSETGLITALRAGTATITVRVDGKATSFRVTVPR